MLATEFTPSCCEDGHRIDFSKMALPEYINFQDSNLWVACLCIIFNPIYWNALARWEYRTKWLSKIVGGPFMGCFLLALTILGLGVYRDWRYQIALQSQPGWWFLRKNFYLWSGHGLVVLGSILVITSFWKLGFFGTFLGDYFGIYLPEKVKGFPFTFFSHPMYMGSFFNFLGIALIQASQAGLFLSALVFVMYQVAIMLEGPFTEMIYENLENERKAEREGDEVEAEHLQDENESQDVSGNKEETSKINTKLKES